MMQKLPKKPTAMGPADSFTGDVYLDGIRGAMDGSRLNMAHVHFAPGARTHWHSHPVGQTLFCTDGSGLVVSRDGTVLTIEPGQTVWIPPLEEHWHGAREDAFKAQDRKSTRLNSSHVAISYAVLCLNKINPNNI